jgi:hypothetical protein
VCEAESFRCHAINMRRCDDLLTVTAKIAIAEIIGHDKDQVRAIGRDTGQAEQAGSHNQTQQQKHPQTLHETRSRVETTERQRLLNVNKLVHTQDRLAKINE